MSYPASKWILAAALGGALVLTPMLSKAGGLLMNIGAKVVEHQAASKINDMISSPGQHGGAAPASGALQGGKVVYVDDGDTVIVLNGANEQVKVRLASIDAPESSHTNKETGRIGQPYSENSKKFLESMVKGKIVATACPNADRYGRQVCTITVDGINVNREMVRAGWAWAFTGSEGRYLLDKSLVQVQAEAQGKRIGIWAGAKPVPPWEWRKSCWEQHICPN
ncbi:micrococcal nuclease [Roseateles asaccharophilus]|uniref:thermonuclease family protein n=1 Tax=Roseateles asaccharophilus TaxID=582607 RepID=UPI00383962A1